MPLTSLLGRQQVPLQLTRALYSAPAFYLCDERHWAENPSLSFYMFVQLGIQLLTVSHFFFFFNKVIQRRAIIWEKNLPRGSRWYCSFRCHSASVWVGAKKEVQEISKNFKKYWFEARLMTVVDVTVSLSDLLSVVFYTALICLRLSFSFETPSPRGFRKVLYKSRLARDNWSKDNIYSLMITYSRLLSVLTDTRLPMDADSALNSTSLSVFPLPLFTIIISINSTPNVSIFLNELIYRVTLNMLKISRNLQHFLFLMRW